MEKQARIDAKTLSFFNASRTAPLTLADSRLCSGLTRPGIETRYLDQAACLRIQNPVQICVPFRG
jgi:hypothetical protein